MYINVFNMRQDLHSNNFSVWSILAIRINFFQKKYVKLDTFSKIVKIFGNVLNYFGWSEIL